MTFTKRVVAPLATLHIINIASMAAPVPNIVPLPVPNLGQDPQPNIGNLQQLIHDVANEVALFQNAPALPAIHNILQQMQQQQAAVLQQLQLLTNSVNITQARYAFFLFLLFIALTHLPTASHLSRCSCSTQLHLPKPHLCYPPALPILRFL